MPCHGCGAEFGIFKKEHGCKKCGFAFCSSCLTKKAVIPTSGNNQKQNVCNRCFDILSGKVEPPSGLANFSEPQALQRRMEALQDRRLSADNAPTGYKGSEKDRELAVRLQKLRQEKRGPVPTQQELEERLLKLKDLVVYPVTCNRPLNTAYQPPDQRTSVEQAHHLFMQFKEEVELDNRRPKPEEEIAARLAKLRKDDEPLNDLNRPSQASESEDHASDSSSATNQPNILHNTSSNVDNMNIDEVHQLIQATHHEVLQEAQTALRNLEADEEMQKKLTEIEANSNRRSRPLCENEEELEEDDDKIADKLIGKLLLEDKLDARLPEEYRKYLLESEQSSTLVEKKQINTPESEGTSDSDELPWCTICNDDAILRCHGCDGDLYCKRCFRECHDSPDLRNHQTSIYNPPKVGKK